MWLDTDLWLEQKYRAQWNAVESVTMATWSGSAVLGGLLVQRYGNGINNIMTATLQVRGERLRSCLKEREGPG